MDFFLPGRLANGGSSNLELQKALGVNLVMLCAESNLGARVRVCAGLREREVSTPVQTL